MLIAATHISPYLDMVCKALGPLPSSTHSIRVQHKSGALWRMATPAEVQTLANEQQIFGTGSRSKLKYATLYVEPEVAQETLDRARNQPTHSQARERLINPQSSQTIWNQPIMGKELTFKAFRHVRNNGFGLKMRQEYQ